MARGLIKKKGSIVHSSIIETSTSKNNKGRACDPESAWTKRADGLQHGYKTHIDAESDSGFVTNNQTTPQMCMMSISAIT